MRLAGEGNDSRRFGVGAALARFARRFDDGALMRAAFFGLLAGTAGVLTLDLVELAESERAAAALEVPEAAEPMLPPAVRQGDDAPATVDPRQGVTADEADLKKGMTFSLEPGGILRASGTIDRGAATRFSGELAARGEYVRTVSLNSPGGSLEDALAMSTLLRERGLSTEVEDGALCASSCPIILAGGLRREAGDKAAVGLHQFYAGSEVEGVGAAQAMSDAQATTARITRHLAGMGIDPALWLHALETPPRRLYYLTPEEMKRYRLVGAAEPHPAEG